MDRIAASAGRRIDFASPLCRRAAARRLARQPRPAAGVVNGPLIAIRRFRSRFRYAWPIFRRRAVGRGAAVILKNAVASRENIVIAGNSGAGKTTLLNALAKEIPAGGAGAHDRRRGGIGFGPSARRAVGDAPPQCRGRRRNQRRAFLSNALRMRPDRLLIGECRGAETLTMIQAMNTGSRRRTNHAARQLGRATRSCGWKSLILQRRRRGRSRSCDGKSGRRSMYRLRKK